MTMQAVRRVLAEGGVTFVKLAAPNVRRAYRVRLQPALWGTDVVLEWGRLPLGTRPRCRVLECGDLEGAVATLERVARRRHARGYRLR